MFNKYQSTSGNVRRFSEQIYSNEGLFSVGMTSNGKHAVQLSRAERSVRTISMLISMISLAPDFSMDSDTDHPNIFYSYY